MPEPTGPPPGHAGSIADVLTDMQTLDPTGPRLTWYGADDERVELSGRVLANWVVKATNLLTEEGGVAPGSVVVVDLPAHWRLLVWSLAAWLAGAQVRLPDDGGAPPVGPDVAVTWRPSASADEVGTDLRRAGTLVAVALPALAVSFTGALPSGALDGARDLMTYPDVLVVPPTADPRAAALDGLEHARLVEWALRDAPPAGTRALVATQDPATALRCSLAAWSLGGAVVLVTDGRDEGSLRHVAAVEGTRTRSA